MSVYNTVLNVLVSAFIIFAIVRCCVTCKGPTIYDSETQATDQGAIQNQETDDGIKPAELRSKVIQTIFPGQTVDDNSKLVYDPESNSYHWTDDTTSDASCAICIESYVSGDVTVSSQCGHVFHRDCIMGWLIRQIDDDKVGGSAKKKNEKGNDECPHCRQLMWDTNAYQQVESELRATWNDSKTE